ncbi:MAG: nitroreductase family deazaflavin-dependent oxidoreductase [Thaumarchaeota archaeon]|nr:nitroreductase family deazaflavin-dependent oxidoreductase [Nitrososphaerota archaeon]MCL5316792.1 nitroreductase family deazaflavin-dependent oxidoreductase [Nitrososphaerota archaeon]
MLSNAQELEVTVKGRRSGQSRRVPVWFVYDASRIYLLPVNGSDSEWFKNVLVNPSVRVSVAGRSVNLVAKPLTDPRVVKRVVEKFIRKYGEEEIQTWYQKLDAALELPVPADREYNDMRDSGFEF